MLKTRYIKPDFFLDEDLARLPFETRILFAGLWCLADKAGRLEDRPERIKVEVFAYDKVDVEKCLNQLCQEKQGSKSPFINRYITVNNQKYIQIINFLKHQKPHHTERESKIPPPDPNLNLNLNSNININIKQHEATLPLCNGEVTVKSPLCNGKNPLKKKYLEYVFLTDEEYKKLLDRMGEVWLLKKIEDLNNYVGSTGKRYRSHYHTIVAWYNKDGNKQLVNKTPFQLSLEKLEKENTNG